MVLYDDKKWLCRLIRTAFTIEDDSGVCEKVLKERPHLGSKQDGLDTSSNSSEDSFDIRDGTDMGHRRRSNTAIRLEKLDKQRKAQNATQNVRVNLTDAVKNDIVFEPIVNYQTDSVATLQNAVNIDKLLKSAPDCIPYACYAKFEASCHPSVPCKRVAIFVSFLPLRLRSYPLKVAVACTARIVELIGLVLWMTSQSYPDVKLKSVHEYNLQIADDDGEWDSDFPPLDHQELISKFSFSHLALVCADGQLEQQKQTYNFYFLLPNASDLRIPLGDPQTTTLQDAITVVINKSGWSKKHGHLVDSSGYHLEKLGNPSVVFKDLKMTLSESKCKEFCVVRNGAKSVQAARASEAASSKPENELPGGRSDLYPVTVTGRFNRVKNALCVIKGRERMDLEFQAKTKKYPFTHITGVKLDASKNRVVVSINQGPQSTVGSYYYTNSSHLQLTTSDINTATELHHRLQSIIDSYPKFIHIPLKNHVQ